MKALPTFTVPYRRKREGKTDYQARLRLLKARVPRIVVRRSLKNIWLQVVEFAPGGDRVVASVHSHELRKLGWKASLNNLPAAYLCGVLLGKKAMAKKVSKAVLDIGLNVSVKGGVWYAALKGLLDAGLDVPHAKEVLPAEERLKGGHIADWARRLKNAPEVYQRTFSRYIKADLDPEKLPAHWEEVRKKVL